MFRNNLVAFILALACFVVLIPNLGSAQADKVKNSMAALKAETGKLGAPAVQSNELHFGKSVATRDGLSLLHYRTFHAHRVSICGPVSSVTN